MAGLIPQNFIDDLNNRIDIVDLIDGYVPLKKAGANYKACCPFHDEKSPSFTVTPVKQFYHCFGCGESGGAINFLMAYDHMEFREAVEKLASIAGMEIPEESQSQAPSKSKSHGVDYYELVPKADLYFRQQIRNHQSKDLAINFLKSHGISGDTALAFGLGYAPAEVGMLSHTIGSTQPVTMGLIATGFLENKDGAAVDRFSNEITIPVQDHRGRVVAMAATSISSELCAAELPSRSAIYNNETELFGLFQSRAGIKEFGSALIVDQPISAIKLHEFGARNVVSTLGCGIKSAQLQKLFRQSQDITYIFNDDADGHRSAWDAANECLPVLDDGCQISFMFIPAEIRADVFAESVGYEAFISLLDKSTSLPEYLISGVTQPIDLQAPGGKGQLVSAAKPIIDRLPSGILKTLVIGQLSALTGIASEAFIETMPCENKESETPEVSDKDAIVKPSPEATTPNAMPPLRRAISLLLQYPSFHSEFLVLSVIRNEQVQGIGMLHSLRSVCEQRPGISPSDLLNTYQGEGYFGKLASLANHQHTTGQITLDDALELIRNNNTLIVEQFNSSELEKATSELESLMKQGNIQPLSDDLLERQRILSEYVRASYKP